MDRTQLQTPGASPASRAAAPTGWRIWHSDDGQDLLEYGLLMALIAIVALGAVAALGNTIDSVFWQTIAANF